MTGQFELFSLMELLQHLASHERTGKLRIDHPRGEGNVWFEAGEIHHAEFDGHTGRNAVYGLLADEQGSFEFIDDVPVPERSIDSAVEDLLLDAIRRTDAGRGRSRSLRETYIGDAIPAVEVQEQLPADVVLSPEEIRFLRYVDGRRSVTRVAEKAGLSLPEARQIISSLVHQGAVKVAERRPRTARLVSQLQRDGLDFGEAGIDSAILSSWHKALGYRPERIACRTRDGLVRVFPVRSVRKAGPFIQLSRDTLLSNNLATDTAMLVKPVPRRPVKPIDS